MSWAARSAVQRRIRAAKETIEITQEVEGTTMVVKCTAPKRVAAEDQGDVEVTITAIGIAFVPQPRDFAVIVGSEYRILTASPRRMDGQPVAYRLALRGTE